VFSLKGVRHRYGAREVLRLERFVAAQGEKKSSTLVFIGRKLPQDLFIAGLEQCLA